MALDSTGDLLLEHNSLQMVDGVELIRQKVQEVIHTNKGEWFYDWEQGVNFSNLTGKGVTEEDVMLEIADGLRQVDEELSVSDLSIAKSGREMTVTFKATKGENELEVSVTTEY